MKTLFLIDGNSFVYRAFYAIKELTNSQGVPTNAIYGFIRMLEKLINTYNPSYLAIAFDKGKITFRHKEYENYKAHRKPMPDSLVSQIPWIKKIIQAYNIPLIESDDYEADDIIATLSERAEEEGFGVFIFTQDKDMMQLVDSDIKVVVPGKNDFIIYDEKNVKEKYGIAPKMFTAFLALTGDKIDNIPGVPGIGEKTASRLLNEFGNLEKIQEAAETMGNNKIKITLQESKEKIGEILELVTLRKDAPLSIKPEDCLRREPDINLLKSIFGELEFRTLLEELERKDTGSADRVMIDAGSWSNTVFQELKACKGFSVVAHDDTLELAYKKDGQIKTVWIRLQNRLKEDLGQLISNPAIAKYGIDLKSVFRTIPCAIEGRLFDVPIARHLLSSAGILLDAPFYDAQKIYEDAPLLEKKLVEEELYDLYSKIELPLIEVLASMETCGIKLDADILKNLSRDFQHALLDLTEKIYQFAGESVNINSPKQLEHILFEKLKLPKGRRTKTGYSTDTEVLSALQKFHELPGYLLEYRKLAKLKGTYIDPLPCMINPVTKRLHTTFNQLGAVTGRLSSFRPSLQNIPVKTELGGKIRQAFVPGKEDWLFLGADYSQIELRLLAHLSQDKLLLDAFNEGLDIHTKTAGEIFAVGENDVTQEMRRQAKTVNFGIIYGMGAMSLAKSLGISQENAKGYIDRYFEHYPGVREYIKETLNFASENGYVLTMFGRKRAIPELKSSRQNIKAMGERIAVNTPLQGSAADIIKLAMINIYRRLKKEGLPANLLLQVHDELIFEVDSKAREALEVCVKDEMEHVVELKVPLVVDIKVGRNWADI